MKKNTIVVRISDNMNRYLKSVSEDNISSYVRTLIQSDMLECSYGAAILKVEEVIIRLKNDIYNNPEPTEYKRLHDLLDDMISLLDKIEEMSHEELVALVNGICEVQGINDITIYSDSQLIGG